MQQQDYEHKFYARSSLKVETTITTRKKSKTFFQGERSLYRAKEVEDAEEEEGIKKYDGTAKFISKMGDL